jgi:hypothetical protein
LIKKLERFQILLEIMPDKINKKETAFLAGLALKSETPEFGKGKLLRLAKKHHSTH